MALKAIKLYSHASGPNPLKVAIILKELQLPYQNAQVPSRQTGFYKDAETLT